MSSNLPPGTWEGDPRAPWNGPECGCADGCSHVCDTCGGTGNDPNTILAGSLGEVTCSDPVHRRCPCVLCCSGTCAGLDRDGDVLPYYL